MHNAELCFRLVKCTNFPSPAPSGVRARTQPTTACKIVCGAAQPPPCLPYSVNTALRDKQPTSLCLQLLLPSLRCCKQLQRTGHHLPTTPSWQQCQQTCLCNETTATACCIRGMKNKQPAGWNDASSCVMFMHCPKDNCECWPNAVG